MRDDLYEWIAAQLELENALVSKLPSAVVIRCHFSAVVDWLVGMDGVY